jgi:hypothetical protein
MNTQVVAVAQVHDVGRVVRREEPELCGVMARRRGLDFPTIGERGVKGYAARSYSAGDR